jgi:hypothetical protein
MKSKLANAINVICVAIVVATSSLVFLMAANPAQVSAASGSAIVEKCQHNFFGLKPWYQYIGNEMDDGSQDKSHLCNVKCFNFFNLDKPNSCGQIGSDVPRVLLAIADDLLRIAGLIALAFIFVGAFKYVTSQGNPESTGKAQETIVNALLGLAISVSAVAIVSFIGNALGKGGG